MPIFVEDTSNLPLQDVVLESDGGVLAHLYMFTKQLS